MEDVDGNRYVDFDLGFGASVRRPLQPDRAQCDRGSTRRRHAVRHAVRVQQRRRRDARGPLQAADVAVHQQRHRGHDGRHSRRSWCDRPRQDRQGRGRLSRPSRRGDDLDEAADQRGRSRRRASRHPCDRGHHTRRARRHQGHSVQPPDLLEKALAGRDVACFIVEPVMENIGICLPQPGYLKRFARSHASTARC